MLMMWKTSKSDVVKALNTNCRLDRPLDDATALGIRYLYFLQI